LVEVWWVIIWVFSSSWTIHTLNWLILWILWVCIFSCIRPLLMCFWFVGNDGFNVVVRTSHKNKDAKVLPKKYQWPHIIDKYSRFLVQKKHIQNAPTHQTWTEPDFEFFWRIELEPCLDLVAKNGMEGSPENARTTQHKYVGYTHAHGHYTYTWATLGIKKYAHKHWPWCLYWSNKQGGASQCGLAIYIKKCLKAKEELWKFKYFTMQKSKRNQNPSRYYNSITNLKFQPKPNISSFKNPHIKIDLLPGGP
jgi:hypothetical protein